MKKGFTLIEVSIVIGVLAMLLVLTFTSFSKLNESEALGKGTLAITSVLNEARSLALSSKESSQYGVHIETDHVILFKGSSFNSSDPTNVRTDLNSYVYVSQNNISGGNVVFDRLTGATSQTGTIILSLKTGSDTKTITVYSTGIIEP